MRKRVIAALSIEMAFCYIMAPHVGRAIAKKLGLRDDDDPVVVKDPEAFERTLKKSLRFGLTCGAWAAVICFWLVYLGIWK